MSEDNLGHPKRDYNRHHKKGYIHEQSLHEFDCAPIGSCFPYAYADLPHSVRLLLTGK
jgi:hypothetical protein